MDPSEIIFIFKWWFIFLLIGASFLPVTTKIFNSFVDKGYIFSKVLGILFISYTIFILSSVHILKFTFENILIVWFLLVAVQILLFRKDKFEFRKFLKVFLIEEVLFFIALFLWSYIKGFNPDIHDLEKFMDFGFINSIIRGEYFPPKDMWFTPFSINYYYFGHLFTSVLIKISHIPSYISFNLMLASIFAFTFTMSFSIGITLIQKIRKFSLLKSIIFGLFFGFVVSFAGNLQTIYAFFKHYESETPIPIWDLAFSFSSFPNSYWYPSATRFIYHTIHEFPLYSFVVADLHGHVLDIPVVLTIISLFLVAVINKHISYKLTLLISFLLSIAYMTNAWDGLIYLGLSIIVIFSVFILNQKGEFKTRLKISFIKSVKRILVLFPGLFIFLFAFNRNFDPFASGIGLNCSPEFLIKLQKIGPFIFEKDFCQITPIWQLLILYGFFFFMLISFLIFLWKKERLETDKFVLLISVFSVLLILVPEALYLKDIYTGHFRANTMFKLSYQAFIMLSISSIYILIRIVSDAKTSVKNSLSKVLFIIFIFGSFFLLFLVSTYPYFAIPSGYGNLNNYKGLDGLKYLQKIKPGDYHAINWINANIKGQPIILEAQGDSYTDYARISSNTGLPTVLGWTVHEWLWRGSYDVPAGRFQDISTLYETKDLKTAKKIIDKYKISYIYIGGLEKEKYKISEEKFSELGKLIYSAKEAKIYKVSY